MIEHDFKAAVLASDDFTKFRKYSSVYKLG